MSRIAPIAALVLALALVGAATAAPQPAPGFDAPALLFRTTQPTDIAFTPDGSLMLVAEKDGRLRVAARAPDGSYALRAEPALDLATAGPQQSSLVCTQSERGLLGVAADPGFATNRVIYLFYTFNRGARRTPPTTTCAVTPPESSAHPVNVVGRYTLGADLRVDPAGERLLIGSVPGPENGGLGAGMPSPAGNHNAGGLEFGKDGALLIAIGDGGCDYAGGGCAGGNDATRDPHVLTGKILRINPNPFLAPSDRIPPDNPFPNGAVCAPLGRVPAGTPAGTPCRETYAFGLRNPFRTAVDPNTPPGVTRFFLNDVGQNVWEEISLGEAGADYRWNACEASSITGTRDRCPAPQGAERNPLHEYDHNDPQGSPDTVGCNSITGGAFVPDGAWPAAYAGAYLFADYVCGKIFAITPEGAPPYARTTLLSGGGAIVDLAFGPGPSGTALYYANIVDGGIYRVTPAAGGNRAPVAVLSASPQFGARTVTFDASGSSDPDGTPLTYEWSFGDGQTATTTDPAVEHTYAPGRYSASLQVRDAGGARSLISATLTIDTENQPPVVTLESPVAGARFVVGERLILRGSATDGGAALPGAALTWEVLLHHRAGQPGAHTHPLLGPLSGAEQELLAPPPEDLDAAGNSYLEVRLTAVDAGGATTTVTRDLLPVTTGVTLASDPPGLTLRLEGQPITTPFTFVGWAGWELDLAADRQQHAQGQPLMFVAWSQGGPATQTVVLPAVDVTYSAQFGPAIPHYIPFVARP